MMKEITKKEKNEELVFKVNKKNVLKGLGIFAIVVLVLGLAFFTSKGEVGAISGNFINITLDEYLNRLNGEEKSIIYIARPTCSWCQKETPVIKKLIGQYDLKVYYLNTEKFYDSSIQDYTEEGYRFMSSSEKYKDGFGTPNTIIVQNGEIVDGAFGYVEAKELKDLLKNNGFIHE